MTFKETIFQRFLDKIEQDRDFFGYYKLTEQESIDLIKLRCSKYYEEAIILFQLLTSIDHDFFKEVEYVDPNTNETKLILQKDLTIVEIDLIANLMREIHYYRGYSRLKAMEIQFSPKDLNVFSPANERKTFMDMVEKIQQDNRVLFDLYNSKDRDTGTRKKIEFLNG